MLQFQEFVQNGVASLVHLERATEYTQLWVRHPPHSVWLSGLDTDWNPDWFRTGLQSTGQQGSPASVWSEIAVKSSGGGRHWVGTVARRFMLYSLIYIETSLQYLKLCMKFKKNLKMFLQEKVFKKSKVQNKFSYNLTSRLGR
jgi:hypothetical protein